MSSEPSTERHSEKQILDLSRAECLRLLAANSFGRVAVNLDEGAPVIRPLTSGLDEPSRTGWSVIMLGMTDEVTSPNEVRRLDRLGLEPWAPGRKAHWVHI